MTASDGYVSGKHKIVDHGADSQRYNVVILGDGYRLSELKQYANDVDSFVATLRATAPYNDLWCAINVYRVDVVSTDSGADDPGTCGDGSSGSGATRKTYFDATFCGDGQLRRLLTCDASRAKSVAKAQVPAVHLTLVIVNTSLYGGSGGDVATFSTNPSSVEIGLHEMGHTAFEFADEYECLKGCNSGETGHDSYSGAEPSEINITTNTDKNTIKWKALLTNAADALPTTANADCTKCDPQGNPKAASYVGAYEGAGHFHCKLYRPQFMCRMRALNNPYCAVCEDQIRQWLASYMPPEILTLTTPSISFLNIPEGVGGIGVTTFRAIVFEIVTCGTRTFRITAGPTGGFGMPLGTVVAVSANDANPVAEARLWLSYTSTTAGSTSSGTITVRNDETGQTWVIPITANTVARPKSAVTLVLDHSGSMSGDAGDATTKVAKLREAANIFVSAMLQGDGLGIVRFDDTAQVLMPVTDVGPPVIGTGRINAIGHINSSELDPAGTTSIGGGVLAGKQTLDYVQAAVSPHYDVTAMVALTDGMENTPPMLADVSGSITANTFAVGLGNPENISVAALDALTQSHHGYLLVTGALTPDQSARLDKYFLQILAGVTNANVILDPHGNLTFGVTQRIPFNVSETDYGLDVFLLCPFPSYVEFALETPNGTMLTPTVVGAGVNVHFVQANRLAYYRLALPALAADVGGTHAGSWNVVLTMNGRRQATLEFASIAAVVSGGSLPYDVVVHCYSNLLFAAHARQTSFEPGATVFLTASLSEYDVPVENRASVWAQVTRPDGTAFTLRLDEPQPGRFEQSFAALDSGLYSMRVRAVGETFYGTAFAREQTLTAAVYPGGNREAGGHDCVPFWCEVLECLLSDRVLGAKLKDQLRELGVDLRVFADCLARRCRPVAQEAPSGSSGIRVDAEKLRALVQDMARELGSK